MSELDRGVCQELLDSLEGYGTDWLRDNAEKKDLAKISAFLKSERERCAKIAEYHADIMGPSRDWEAGRRAASADIAAKIRSGK